MSIEKVPNAEEFLNRDYVSTKENAIQAMTEFAKLHVKAALKAAAENALIKKDSYPLYSEPKTEMHKMFNYPNRTSHYVHGPSILDAYPESNIE
jgi:hypothetical protein